MLVQVMEPFQDQALQVLRCQLLVQSLLATDVQAVSLPGDTSSWVRRHCPASAMFKETDNAVARVLASYKTRMRSLNSSVVGLEVLKAPVSEPP